MPRDSVLIKLENYLSTLGSVSIKGSSISKNGSSYLDLLFLVVYKPDL